MKSRHLIITTLLLFSTSAWAIRDEFKPINGKTYYQLLEVSADATTDQIKSAHRTMIKKFHPDLSPDNMHIAKDINAVYDVLKNPEKRKRYDRWLGIASKPNTSATDSGSSTRNEKEKEKTLDEMFLYTKQASAQMRGQSPNMSFDEIANQVRSIIIYQMRFLPNGFIKNKDLWHFIEKAALLPDSYKQSMIEDLIIVAGGGIKYLQVRAQEQNPFGREARQYLLNIVDRLHYIMTTTETQHPQRLHMANEIWRIINGRPFFADPQQAATNCASLLHTATFTDQNGNKYEIPIEIKIKIGF